MYRGEACYRSLMEYDRYRKIQNRLQQYRKAKELTQSQVAAILGFKDKTWISHWETGDALPNLISAMRLSVLFQVHINDLFPELEYRIREEKKPGQ